MTYSKARIELAQTKSHIVSRDTTAFITSPKLYIVPPISKKSRVQITIVGDENFDCVLDLFEFPCSMR
jgi:hypothetical protein